MPSKINSTDWLFLSLRKRDILLYIFLLIVIVFSPSLQGDFLIWDDDHHVAFNQTIRDLSFNGIKEIFTSTVEKTYIPLTLFSYALEFQLFGLKPAFYHMNNLFLHLGVVGIGFLLALRMGLTLPFAAVAVLIFGVHPMHVESVSWATERKDVLYAFFYMLALLSYFFYVSTSKGKFFILSLVCAGLSVLSKAMALSLPFILCLFDWWMRRPITLKTVMEKLIFAAAIWPIVLITYVLNARMAGSPTLTESALTWAWTLTFYLRKFIFPVELIPLYTLPQPVSLRNFEYVMAFITLTIILILLYVLKKQRWPLFAFLFYFLSIFFLLRFDSIDTSIVADRFMYLPSYGFCLWIGALLQDYFSSTLFSLKLKVFGSVFVGVIVLLLGWKAYEQNKIWKNSLTFWNYVIAKQPNITLSYNSRGVTLMDQRDYKGALKDFNQALRMDPYYVMPYYNRGWLLKELEKYPLAVADFTRAIQLDPAYGASYSQRAEIYYQWREFDKAIKDLNESLRLSQKEFQDYNLRGMIYAKEGKDDLALADFNRAIAVNPDFAEAYWNRSRLWERKGDRQKVLADLNRFIALDPASREAHYERLKLRWSLGQRGEVYLDYLKLKEMGFAMDDPVFAEIEQGIRR